MTTTIERYGFHTRVVGKDKWIGFDNYLTLDDAKQAMRDSINMAPVQLVGTIGVEFKPYVDVRYERKITKVIKTIEVIEEQRD